MVPGFFGVVDPTFLEFPEYCLYPNFAAHSREPMKLRLLFILVAIIVSELITVFVGVLPGLLAYSVVLTLAALDYVWSSENGGRKEAFVAIALIVVSRLASYSMPYEEVPMNYWLLLSGLPPFFGLLTARIFLGIRFRDMGLKFHFSPILLFYAGLGALLGMIAYGMEPQILEDIQDAAVIGQIVFVISLIVFGGWLEEVIYRGLLNPALIDSFGLRWGLLFSSLLYGLMFVGTLSVPYVVLMICFAIVLSWTAQYSKTIWFGIVAHVLFLMSFYLTAMGYINL